ncbi:MAG: hypothetical protein ACXAC8_17645 [Candidatus Hodarchaeales archaeon]|jgi:hypothetical protein
MVEYIDLSKIPKSLNIPLNDSLRKAMAIAISIGFAENVPDFARKCFASKLEELGIFNEQVRNLLASSLFE